MGQAGDEGLVVYLELEAIEVTLEGEALVGWMASAGDRPRQLHCPGC